MTRDVSFERAVGFAQELIRIPGASGAEGAVAERVEHEMDRLGYDDVGVDEVGNVIGRIRGTGDGATVLVNSHLDVVDAGDPEGWEHPPYGGDVADGFLHGRGAMDIKGPLALQTYAAARLLDDRVEGDVVVAHTVYEERGGWGMSHLLESGAVRPDAVVIGEATQGDVCVGHRGRAELVIEIGGVAGHASAPERARNPIDAVGRVAEAVRAFDARLESRPDPVLGRSSIAATDIEVLPKSRNVIPDRVRVVVDWRVLPGTTADAAVERLDAFLRERVTLPGGCSLDVRFGRERQRSYTGRDVERRLFSPGFLLDPDHPVAEAAARAVAETTGETPGIRPWTFATDGGHSCGVHGVPTIGFAPGEERFAHTDRERLELASARIAYDAYPPLIRAVQRALA